MVSIDGAARDANLVATPFGSLADEEPTWSGNGTNGDPGSLTAVWSSSQTGTGHAEAPGGGAEVQVKIYSENRRTEPFDDQDPFVGSLIGDIGNQIKDEFNDLFVTTNFTTTISRTGSYELWTADKYDDPEVGTNVRLTGEASIAVEVTDTVGISDVEIFGYTVGIDSASISFHAEGELKATATDLLYDISKPEGSRLSGSLDLTGQLGLSGSYLVSEQIDLFGIDSADFDFTLSCSPFLTAGITDFTTGALGGVIGVGDIVVNYNVTVHFEDDTDWTYGAQYDPNKFEWGHGGQLTFPGVKTVLENMGDAFAPQ